jgi:hypothetical protein
VADFSGHTIRVVLTPKEGKESSALTGEVCELFILLRFTVFDGSSIAYIMGNCRVFIAEEGRTIP